MGITNHCAKFILHCLKEGVSYTDTIMLGRQVVYATPAVIERLTNGQGGFKKTASGNLGRIKYAESFFQLLGARRVDSLDCSEYEKATIIHDLNRPIGDHLKKKYSVVFDGGTLEHVFNFPMAIQNCMDLLRVGGHFISITPANNQMGHGFYQFSPELFYSVFSPQSGFKIKRMLIRMDLPGKNDPEVYEVVDPHLVKSRVSLINALPTSLMILAEKISDIAQAEVNVFQSDYEQIWQTQSHKIPTARRIYRSLIPDIIREKIWTYFRSAKSKEEIVSGLGKVNPKYFRRIDY